jgi:class 3 adenylate cyclase
VVGHGGPPGRGPGRIGPRSATRYGDGVELPTGTVPLLFTDIEDSTRLLRSLGDDYGPVMAHADWLIDLVASSDSLTARHLRTYLERA